MNSGIYAIVNTANGKRYIGSAANFSGRWKTHLHELRHGFHHSVLLQRAWNKHGADAFQMRPVMLVEQAELISWEQRYLDEFKPEYNICSSAAAPMTGRKHTAEAKAKIGAASLGNKNSLGKHPSPEARARQIAAQTGLTRSGAQRANMSKAQLGQKKIT